MLVFWWRDVWQFARHLRWLFSWTWTGRGMEAWPPSLGLQTRAAGLLTTIVAISAECAGMPGKSLRKGDGFGINSLYRWPHNTANSTTAARRTKSVLGNIFLMCGTLNWEHLYPFITRFGTKIPPLVLCWTFYLEKSHNNTVKYTF